MTARVQMICPVCRGTLATSANAPPRLACTACGRGYPCVGGGGIPILVAEPQRQLVRACVRLERHRRQQAVEARTLADAAVRSPARAPLLAAMQRAIEKNVTLHASLQHELLAQVSTADVLAEAVDGARTASDGPAPYLTGLEYLRRDWCGEAEAEQELAVVRNAVEPLLRERAPDRQRVLVLGAGAGRLAWDLGALFDEVCAVDLSVMMAHQFGAVCAGDTTLWALETTSCLRSDELARPLRASLAVAGGDAEAHRRRRERVSYVVADAARLPLPDGSVSAVVSAFFTDVAPLAQWLGEVRRVLAPDGVFVHFGPLEYHFRDRAHHLAADEVRRRFLDGGFEIASEDWVRAHHLSPASTMAPRLYDCWVLCAVARGPDPARPVSAIDLESVLAIQGELRYELRGVLARGTDAPVDATLDLPSGERFDGAIDVLDILRLLDGRRSVREVIAALLQRYTTEDDPVPVVLGALRALASRGVLAVPRS